MMRDTTRASARPIDARHVALDLGRVGGQRFVLRRLRDAAKVEQRQRFDQRERAHLGKTQLQFAVGLVVGDRRAHLQESTGPASSAFTIRMIVTPVSAWPSRIAA